MGRARRAAKRCERSHRRASGHHMAAKNRRYRTSVADQLMVMVVDVNVGAEHLLGAQKRRQIFLHSNNCTTDAGCWKGDMTRCRPIVYWRLLESTEERCVHPAYINGRGPASPEGERASDLRLHL